MTGQFPVKVEPAPGESLLSLADRVAWAHRIPPSLVYAELGLGVASGVSALRPVDVERAAWILRLDRLAIERCAWPAVIAGRWTALRVSGSWNVNRGAKPCGLCVKERNGVWLTAWHVGWSVACVRHGVTLLERCGTCRNRYKQQRSARLQPPDECGSWSASKIPLPCRAKPGAEPHRPASDADIAAQAAFDAALADAVAAGPDAIRHLLTTVTAVNKELGSGVQVGVHYVCRPAPTLTELVDAAALTR